MGLTFDRTVFSTGMRLFAMALICAGLAACGSTKNTVREKKRPKEFFAESEYGVKASPRVHTGRNVPKGGGRFQLGKPYKVKGKWYVPKEDRRYNKVGLASWYGSAFHGRLTANGEVYDQYHLSAAHPTFPLPSYARVTNLETGSSVVVRVNDRGPYHPGRIIDVSDKAAALLDMKHHGTAKVRVQYVGKARMDGQDMAWLMASYRRKGDRSPAVEPEIATGVMVASNETTIGMPDADQSPSAATALTETARPIDSFAAMTEFPVLPDIGPIPRERPAATFSVARLGGAPVLAYTETGVRAHAAFDAVLTGQAEPVQATGRERLTAEMIRAFWLKRTAERR